jgi:hypothetical protein
MPVLTKPIDCMAETADLYVGPDGMFMAREEWLKLLQTTHKAEPLPLPIETGVYMLYCENLQQDKRLILDFNLTHCRQVRAGWWPKWTHDFAKDNQDDESRPQDINVGIVEWGYPLGHAKYDKRKVGVLIGAIDLSKSDQEEYFTVVGCKWSKDFVHMHMAM